MKELKYSRQREAILEELRKRHDHPTADLLYRSLRESFPRISLGTVYRNLNLLADLGQISRIRCEEGMEHFDCDTCDHYHFVCRSCGKILDLPMDIITDLDARAESAGVGSVETHSLLFYGRCSACGTEDTAD
jgi:Fur family peroxide stress response transcriptional regulator